MNMQLSREDYDKLVKSGNLEQYTQQQFDAFVSSNEEILQKGNSTEELDELEKSEYDNLVEEIKSFARVEVWDVAKNSNMRLEKSIMYVRPEQVKWDEETLEKSEDGELIKAKSGTYTDTPLNRKLGRVGQKYGSKKESESKKENSQTDKVDKVTMNNLDWGKTTEERNANLDKYDSLKTEEEKEAFKKKLKAFNTNKIDK